MPELVGLELDSPKTLFLMLSSGPRYSGSMQEMRRFSESTLVASLSTLWPNKNIRLGKG